MKNHGKIVMIHPSGSAQSRTLPEGWDDMKKEEQVCVVREMGGWYNGERYSGVVSRETVKM